MRLPAWRTGTKVRFRRQKIAQRVSLLTTTRVKIRVHVQNIFFCLSLVSAPEQTLVFSKPVLPAFLPKVSIRSLRVGDARVDLLLARHDEGDVGMNVLRRDGALEVLILK